ncbi:EAL domain-containing protein, partial [Chromobacterium piscinae]
MTAFEHAGLKIGSHFQPVYSLAHRRSIGVEALLRAEQGKAALTPAEAFYTAISPEQRHQLDVAVSLAHIQRFLKLESEHPRWLFLNIDAASLSRPDRAMALVNNIRQAGLEPHQVVLEVLEHVLEVDEALLEGVHLLKNNGFMIAIDDFGVGHSNLERVCQLEPSLVKFDRQLMRNAITQPRSRSLLARLVRLMHEIGALVVLEGIETERDVLVAMDSGCDLIQG